MLTPHFQPASRWLIIPLYHNQPLNPDDTARQPCQTTLPCAPEQRCCLYVMDTCAMVTIDDCKECCIFIGPTDSR